MQHAEADHECQSLPEDARDSDSCRGCAIAAGAGSTCSGLTSASGEPAALSCCNNSIHQVASSGSKDCIVHVQQARQVPRHPLIDIYTSKQAL